ncbi:MAG: M15 family metallopeptidase [Alphaproteobacteria bacterium]|nr:M15 family metallopeptidase [Alphaproteobacteria bacterium]
MSLLLLTALALAAEPPHAGAPPPAATPSPPPAQGASSFQAETSPISDALWAQMDGVTWRPGCPVGREDLAQVTVRYHGVDGQPHDGLLIVAGAHADGVIAAFSALWDAGFPLVEVAPAHSRGGSDDRLMADNVTSAFNCRPVAGGSRYSEHSYGHAIDINPLWNPYVRGERVWPEAGRPFIPREPGRIGTITADDAVVRAFRAIGWTWGGTWRSSKDYQHFSATGR